MRKLVATLIVFCLIATGCGLKTVIQPRIALEELSFEVAPGANDDTAFALELVAVSDDALLGKLQDLTAAQWFDPQASWRRDDPQTIQSWHYELTPDSNLQLPQPLPFARRPGRALLLFANYKVPGAHRVRLESFKKARVIFGASGIGIDVIH